MNTQRDAAAFLRDFFILANIRSSFFAGKRNGNKDFCVLNVKPFGGEIHLTPYTF